MFDLIEWSRAEYFGARLPRFKFQLKSQATGVEFIISHILFKTRLNINFNINTFQSSSQDGGVGRNPSLPCTTKRRITTNLKSINNQKCQKIKLHGTPTTKELKKQSARPTRLVNRWTERTPGKAVDHASRAG